MSKELLLPCPFLSIGVFYSLQDVFNLTQFCYREHSINRHTFYECPLMLLSANGITQCFLPTVTPREHWLCPAVSSPAAQPADPCFNIIAVSWHFLTSRLVLNVFGATEDLGDTVSVSSVWICPSHGCRALGLKVSLWAFCSLVVTRPGQWWQPGLGTGWTSQLSHHPEVRAGSVECNFKSKGFCLLCQ